MREQDDRTGKKVRIILIGNYHYSGVILFEDETSITIKDKFEKQVSLNKNSIQVLEVSE